MQPLYNYGKPFILGELAPWGIDDPVQLGTTHPRTAALVDYDYSSPSTWAPSRAR